DPEADKYLAWKADLSGLKNLAIQSEGNLGVSPFIEELLDDDDAGAVFDTLGIPAFIKTLLDDETAGEALLTLCGLTTKGDLAVRGTTNPESLAVDQLAAQPTQKAFVHRFRHLMSAFARGLFE
ncbi:unnamed protein product, partial [marine sediment metagenome]